MTIEWDVHGWSIVSDLNEMFGFQIVPAHKNIINSTNHSIKAQRIQDSCQWSYCTISCSLSIVLQCWLITLDVNLHWQHSSKLISSGILPSMINLRITMGALRIFCLIWMVFTAAKKWNHVDNSDIVFALNQGSILRKRMFIKLKIAGVFSSG